ncbi:MAG: ribosomal protein L7/L12, partial [Methanomassiliicoccaceae archaeon]|nr:ribosomal protein L7/L12 [Methanomassiliicoccaceae archaeon]
MKQLTTPDNLLKKTATADLVQTAPKTVEKAEIVAARDDIRADGSAVKDNFVLTDFTVILISYGDKKVSVTTAVREITNLGLKESKDLVDAAPKAVKENISRDEANTVVEKLTSAGATVEVRASGLVRPNVSTHVRTLFDVILIACGEKKVEVIKVVRQITGLG